MNAYDEQGNIRNLKTTASGALEVAVVEGGGDTPAQEETTLISDILTIGTTATSVTVNKTVTSIMIANYSETADITVNDGTTDFKIGSNIATELPINKLITNLSITSTAADTKIQLVVKGVE